jgi:hypothetical protein
VGGMRSAAGVRGVALMGKTPVPRRVPAKSSPSKPYQRSKTAIQQDEDRIVSKGNAAIRRRRSGETDMQPVPSPAERGSGQRIRRPRISNVGVVTGVRKPPTDA